MSDLPTTKPSNIVPVNRERAIAWYLGRIDGWQLDGGSLGINPASAAGLADSITAADAAQTAYARLQRETAAAGVLARSTESTMNRRGNAVIRTIRAFADASDDPGAIYAAANIPAPATPVPSGPPATPTAVVMTLSNGGVVRVTWKGSSANTTFVVERSLRMADGTEVPYHNLGGNLERPFNDTTLPAGTVTAFYRVQAQRRGKSSDWSQPGALQLVNNTPGQNESLRLAA